MKHAALLLLLAASIAAAGCLAPEPAKPFYGWKITQLGTESSPEKVWRHASYAADYAGRIEFVHGGRRCVVYGAVRLEEEEESE
ncbi:MAG TPA: hypothetical protein VNU68_07170 [Verrucomicrobiae bacterium]|nr:hypothetical protein [Verrucomicrobiae bacterium]